MLINNFIIIIYFLNIHKTCIRIGNELFLIIHNVPTKNKNIYIFITIPNS